MMEHTDKTWREVLHLSEKIKTLKDERVLDMQ
jgi:hypothetical protein